MESDSYTRQRGSTASDAPQSADAEAAPVAAPSSQVIGRLAAIPEALEPLAKPFYAVALLLTLIPILDFWATVAPTQWNEVRWRFGALGIFSGFLLTPLFGAVVTMSMAAMMEHRRMQFVWAIINAVIGTIVIAAAALFTLDAVQIRGQLAGDSARAFDLVAMRTTGKLVLGAAMYFWLCRAGFKSYGKTRLPEGWQPGDPVPIVNTDSVNLEGLTTEPPTSERVSREMLIGPGAVNMEGVASTQRGTALRSDMVMRPDEINTGPAAPQRRSEELLVRPGKATGPEAPARVSQGVSRDMLISNDALPEDEKSKRQSGGVTKDMLIVGGEEPEK
jgi:hypothetical protein